MLANIALSTLTEAVARTMPAMDKQLCEAYAARLIREIDERLEPNILQWLSGRPLTDIWFGSYSIGMVMQIQGGQDFLGALEALNRYIADPVAGERMIWRTIR